LKAQEILKECRAQGRGASANERKRLIGLIVGFCTHFLRLIISVLPRPWHTKTPKLLRDFSGIAGHVGAQGPTLSVSLASQTR
jgi:hypothetical protein